MIGGDTMNYIEIDLSNPDSLTNYDRVAGRCGESFVKGIKFTLPPQYSNWAVFVETQNANKYKKKRLVTDIQNGVAIYKFQKKDLCAKGSLIVDLVLENGESVYKPFNGEFSVKYAICAPDDVTVDSDDDMSGCASKTEVDALKYLISKKQDMGNYITSEQLDDIIADILPDDDSSIDCPPEHTEPYVLTEKDKLEIADIVVSLLPSAEGERY